MAMNPRLLRPLAGFDPRSIAGLAAWWDASAASTLFDAASGGSVQSADDGLVARLEDRSGNGRHCTQSGVDTIKPILKTGQINGRNVLRFDGSDDRMTFTSIAAQVFTVLLVGRKWNSATDTFVGIGQANAALPYAFVDIAGTGTYVSKSTGGLNGAFSGNTTRQLLRTTPFLSTADSSISLWIDGSSISFNDTGTAAGASTTAFNVLAARTGGSPIYGKQDIGEVLFYNRVLSAGERQRAEGYLAWKWGLQAQLPYDHPYAAGFPGFGSQQTPSDPDALTYLSAVKAADGTGVETAVAMAVDDFFRGCKADGIWDAIKASCILCGARTLAGALVPLVGTAPTNNNFVAADYNRETGLIGNGSTKYIDSNRLTTDDGQDNAHIAVYQSQAASSGANVFMAHIGAVDATPIVTQITEGFPASANIKAIRMRDLGATVAKTSTNNANGLQGASRAVSSSFTYRAGGTNTTFNVVSSAMGAINYFVFAQNENGVVGNRSNARLAFYSIGESLDLAKLDARISSLVTAIGAAI